MDHSAMEDKIKSLERSIVSLEERITEYDRILGQVGEAVEKAKANPMVANLMRGLGLG